MQSFAIFFTTLMATFVAGQGVTSAVAPEASAPASCVGSYDGSFEITVAKVEGAVKRDVNTIAKRSDCATDGILVATLENGAIKDSQGRTGYIAANYQFQFDQPAQTGALFTSGFSVCGNGSLALGGSAVFYECASGDFFNLYDRSWAAQCSPVEILVMECGGNAGEVGDGQVVGTEIVTTTIVSALSDGQPQVRTTTTGIPVCQVSQIADGQLQVGTTPCASITTTPVATSTPVPVSQQSDGQIQVTPPASVPTVTNAPPPPAVTPSAPAGSAPAGSAPAGSAPAGSAPAGSAPAASGGSAAQPSGTQPASSGTTLATTATGGGASGTTPASSATSAPATGGGAAVQAGSMGALVVGVIGAVAFL